MTTHDIKKMIYDFDSNVEWAILELYKQQTAEEKDSHSTNEENGRGFNGADAEFGTSLAERLLKGDELSVKQIVAARKMLMKYCNQLAKLHNNKENNN